MPLSVIQQIRFWKGVGQSDLVFFIEGIVTRDSIRIKRNLPTAHRVIEWLTFGS